MTQSKATYLSTIPKSPIYPVFKTHLDFFSEAVKYFELPDVFAHVDEQVCARIFIFIVETQGYLFKHYSFSGTFSSIAYFSKNFVQTLWLFELLRLVC